MMKAILILLLCFVGLLVISTLAACMLSSQISQDEEKDKHQ